MTKEDVVSAAFIVAGGARAEALASRGKHTIAGRTTMEIGASIFFTEYSISPTELAPALEERLRLALGRRALAHPGDAPLLTAGGR
jgi:hypothetical protein